jgi:hypothetical protein
MHERMGVVGWTGWCGEPAKGRNGRRGEKICDSQSHMKREDCNTKSKFKLHKQSINLTSTQQPRGLVVTADGRIPSY